MATVVLCPCNVVNFLDGGGGHFWVYMQYALGLKQLGCDVYWLEAVRSRGSAGGDAAPLLSSFSALMEQYGFADKFLLYDPESTCGGTASPAEYLSTSRADAEAVFRRADLLLNFHYAIAEPLLACFRHTALVDIDPGLLQFWMSAGQLKVPRHDVYLSTGETVGTPAARFPDCGITWQRTRPIVCVDAWPYRCDARARYFTTVSNWYGHDDWIVDGSGQMYENTKRAGFLEYGELPRHTPQPLELALFLSETPDDVRDRKLMESFGWSIRHSTEVARTPADYQAYVQQSRGEFSCVKPSCIKFQNAWVSDRTLCYLASGKPAVVQHTGASALLPSGEGLFRFSTLAEAVDAFAQVNACYERHSRAARDIAESLFDAKKVLPDVLNRICR